MFRRVTALAFLCCSVFMSSLNHSATAQELSDGTSRDAPTPFGDTVVVNGYELSVLDVIPDATDIVLETNARNSQPQDGHVYYMVRIKATYVGNDSGHAWSGLHYNVVGNQNLGYSARDYECGVIPDPGSDTPMMFQSGSVEFNVCWEVPVDEVGSFVMYVEPNLILNNERVWLSLDHGDPATPTA